MKVNPITRADVHRNVFLSWCSVYCFPVWVLLTCSELFWLLSFSQIKAKWFYLMFYFLCFDLIYMCMIHLMYWDLFPVLSVHLLLRSNSFSQNQALWPYCWGFLFQLGTEDLESHCPTKGGWLGSHRSNVICKEKNTFDLLFRSLVLLRFWACTILHKVYSHFYTRQTTMYSSPFHMLWEHSKWPFNIQALRTDSGTHKGAQL